jgi:hypothetical protein
MKTNTSSKHAYITWCSIAQNRQMQNTCSYSTEHLVASQWISEKYILLW